MNDCDNSHDSTTLKCGPFLLPLSALISEKTQGVLRQRATEQKNLQASMTGSESRTMPDRVELREQFYQTAAYRQLRARYPVTIQLEKLGGIPVEVINPKAGVSDKNHSRVLLNFHGGSFMSGSRIASQLESIPIAALGRIRVVSVDYRLYPEYRYPAATDDAVTAYKALLAHYAPTHIGLFGTSSGAALCAQTLAQLQEINLPLPCAVAMIGCGAAPRAGDSVAIAAAICKAQSGFDLEDVMRLGYYEGVDMSDPQVTPALSDHYMAEFPPTFLASSTRDFLLSSVLATHRKLVQFAINTELHVWEGLGHFFHSDCDLPETQELHQLTLNFFTEQFERTRSLSG